MRPRVMLLTLTLLLVGVGVRLEGNRRATPRSVTLTGMASPIC
jgi:hypothetical protein